MSRFPNAKVGANGPSTTIAGGSNLMRSLRNTEMRRSSAAGLSAASQRPPLPPKIENRCHSYDGLLGDDKKRTAEGRDSVDAKGPTSKSVEGTPEPIKPTEESVKAKNRRSRSMDDLFDDNRSVMDFLESTQSMENLTETVPQCEPESPVKTLGNICLNRRFVDAPEQDESGRRCSDTGSPESCYEQPCENEVITVNNTPRAAEDDVLSTTSSLTTSSGEASNSGNKKTNKPFINKYMKKVKSLMKK